MPENSDRYVVISTDGHCGADLRDYKPYLEKRFHEEFDAWADTYYDGWIETDMAVQAADPNQRLGQASFEAPLNWESQNRLRLLEEQGVVAEVLYPNTAAPFFPSGALTAAGPRDAKEYEYRWAGLRAHNRWLADFCADAPGRRAGMIQIFLEDIDAAVAEVRWAKEAGLKGVLLPAPHVQKMVNLYYPEYDALWAVCQDLEMPIATHVAWITEHPSVVGPGAVLAGVFELNFYPKRQIAHLIASGAFERFPKLMLAATEMNDSSTIPQWLAGLDATVEHGRQHSNFDSMMREGINNLSRNPGEYFATNVFVASPTDVLRGMAAGVQNLMFGTDLPHGEGVYPYTRELLRMALPQLSESERRAFLYERQAKVFGFDLELLGKLAAQFGPRMEDVQTPLPDSECPRWPEDTRSPMLHRAA